MTDRKKHPGNEDISLDIAKKQTSEYAMALDLLSKVTQSLTEKETTKNILAIFSTLFSPQALSYVSIKNDQLAEVFETPLSVDNETAVKDFMADPDMEHAWTGSRMGFLVKIKCHGTSLGIMVVDEVIFPEHIEHYLNLTLSIIGVCGLALENAQRYEKIINNESILKQEKEKLEAALSEVKKLSGLLPICSYCKKIRDDKGYWNQIEKYIDEHSEATFSHSICQECGKKHFPGMSIFED